MEQKIENEIKKAKETGRDRLEGREDWYSGVSLERHAEEPHAHGWTHHYGVSASHVTAARRRRPATPASLQPIRSRSRGGAGITLAKITSFVVVVRIWVISLTLLAVVSWVVLRGSDEKVIVVIL